MLNSRAETLGTVKGNCGRQIYVRHGANVNPLHRRTSGKQIAISVGSLLPSYRFDGNKKKKNTTFTVLCADFSTFQDFVCSTEGGIFVLPQTIVLKQRKISSLAAAQQMKLQVFFSSLKGKKLKDPLEKKKNNLNLETSQMDVFR